jgi:hypothetical protein
VPTEPLTEFEIQHPDPKEREAARTWMEFATSFGMAPSMAAMAMKPWPPLRAFNNAPRAGKSRLTQALLTLEMSEAEIREKVTFNAMRA